MTASTYAQHPDLTEEVLKPLVTELGQVRKIAVKLGLPEWQVSRAMKRHGLKPNRPRSRRDLSPEQIAWARRCAGEGMWANWIAETLQVSPIVIQRLVATTPGRKEGIDELLHTWNLIRQKEHLLDWHHRFSPRSTRAGRTQGGM